MSEPAALCKGACVKCGGHIGFPPEAAGTKVPCPHFRALTPLLVGEEVDTRLYYKCACSTCGGNLKYPADNIGNAVTCPHCGGQTTLVAPGSQSRVTAVAAAVDAPATVSEPPPATKPGPRPVTARAVGPAAAPGAARPPAPPAPAAAAPRPAAPKPALKVNRPEAQSGSKTGKKVVIAIVVAVVVIGLVVAGILLVPKMRKKGGGAGPAAPTGDLYVLPDFRFQKVADTGLIYVVGTVTNTTKNTFFNLKIEFDLVDGSNTKLGSATDIANSLEGGKGWQFRAAVLDKNAESATNPRISKD